MRFKYGKGVSKTGALKEKGRESFWYEGLEGNLQPVSKAGNPLELCRLSAHRSGWLDAGAPYWSRDLCLLQNTSVSRNEREALTRSHLYADARGVNAQMTGVVLMPGLRK